MLSVCVFSVVSDVVAYVCVYALTSYNIHTNQHIHINDTMQPITKQHILTTATDSKSLK